MLDASLHLATRTQSLDPYIAVSHLDKEELDHKNAIIALKLGNEGEKNLTVFMSPDQATQIAKALLSKVQELEEKEMEDQK